MESQLRLRPSSSTSQFRTLFKIEVWSGWLSNWGALGENRDVKTLGEQGCKEIEGVPSQASIVARLKSVDVLGNRARNYHI